MDHDEPWGLKEDEPRYQPATEDITDDESDPAVLALQAKMGSSYMNDSPDDVEWSNGRKKEPYKCDRCEFATGDFMSFITHKNAHSEQEKRDATLFTCGMCEYATPNPQHMSEHIHKHMSQPAKEPITVAATTNGDNDEQMEDVQVESLGNSSSQLDNTLESDLPLLITEVKSTASSEELQLPAPPTPPSDEVVINSTAIEKVAEETTNQDIKSDPSQAVETLAPNTIEPSDCSAVLSAEKPDTVSVTATMKCNEVSATSEKQDSDKTKDPIEVAPILDTTPSAEASENSEQPLKWVTITEARAESTLRTLNHVTESDSTDAIADNSLIGYLELRRIKPSVPTQVKKVEEKNVAEQTCGSASIEAKLKDEGELFSSAIAEVHYKQVEPVFVRYSGNKKKVTATDKKARTIKEAVGPLILPKKSSNTLKSLAEAPNNLAKNTKATKQRDVSKKSILNDSASKVVKQENHSFSKSQRSTRSRGPPLENPPGFLYKPKESTQSRSHTKLCEKELDKPPKNSNEEVAHISRVTRSANEEPKTAIAAVTIAPLCLKNNIETLEPNTINDTTSLSDVHTSIDEDLSNEGQKYSSVYLRLHKKPKKNLLLRYQSEQSRESLSESPEPCDEELQPNKVLDIVAPACKASTNFQTAKMIAIDSNTLPVENVAVRDVGANSLCKIVLSRCRAIDSMVTPKIADKLKSSLRNCWDKVLLKSTSPDEKAKQSPKVFPQPKILESKKRKLLIEDKSEFNVPKKVSKVYRCEFCDYSTGDKKDLITHSTEKHTEEEKMYICDRCDYITSRQSKLIAHIKMHVSPYVQASEENCEKVQLMNGSDSASAERKTLENLPTSENVHLHADENETVTPNLSRPAREASSVSKNTELDEKHKPYACKYCPYRAAKLFNLQSHERSHEGTTKQYRCKHCDFAASRFGHYVEHQYTHKSSSELSCFHEDCEFTTSNPQVLKSHRLLHKVIPQHICDQCGYTTFRKDFLDKHYTRQHSGDTAMSNKRWYRTTTTPKEQPFKCAICWYSARDSKTLAKHMRIHATRVTGNFRCVICKFEAKTELTLKKHLKNSKKCDKLRIGTNLETTSA